MKALAGPLLALLLLSVVAAADLADYVPRLPSQVAAHVNESGQVNAWADKNESLAGTAWWGGIVTLVALGIGSLMALGVRFLPYQFVNLPNKDYWLATPRRRREAAFLSLALCLWMLVSLLLAMVFITHKMFVTTLRPEAPPSALVAVSFVVGLLLFILVRVALFVYRLSHPTRVGGPRRRTQPGRSES
jgi:uncharacterized membrane protein